MNTKSTNYRLIHTNLYTNIANEVLQSVEGQLSDGIWENSTRMERYWLFSLIERAANGEVVIRISNDRYDNQWRGRGVQNGFKDMDDAEVIRWFAAKVKAVMMTELKDEFNGCTDGWKRNNTKFETRYLNYDEKITVADVYFIYDFLMDRKISGRYSTEMIDRVCGHKRSAAKTKVIEAKQKMIAKLDAKYAAEIKAIDEAKKLALEKLEKEFNAKRAAAHEAYRIASDAINKH